MSNLIPNRPTPEGRELGVELARLADKADAELREKFPNARERCKSCAFRSGTVPNGCVPTLMDALKCAMEGTPFYCHETLDDGKPTQLCAGWSSAVVTGNPVKAPWPYSMDEEGQ